jgi:excinuclease UvrABC helicase subunit UvrB
MSISKIEVAIPAGIVSFLEDHKAYMTEREGAENMTELLETFITQGFDAMIDDWHLKAPEVHAEYNIPD